MLPDEDDDPEDPDDDDEPDDDPEDDDPEDEESFDPDDEPESLEALLLELSLSLPDLAAASVSRLRLAVP